MEIGAVEFDRQYRTGTSEGYHLRSPEGPLGRIDLHFASSNVYATLVIRVDLAEEHILRLIERIDETLVLSAETRRDDLYVTVFRGEEVGFYSDDFHAEKGREVRLRAGSRLEQDLDAVEDVGAND